MKILVQHPSLQLLTFVFAVSFLLTPITSTAQRSADKNQSKKTAIQKIADDPRRIRWKIFLDSLAQESRTVFPEERRPYAMVEVANAYWEIDRDASRSLFIAALDKALSLTHEDKKYRTLVNYVLSSATKRDPALTRELSKRLLEDKSPDRDNISSKAALDLLDENPAAAAQLAEAFAPNGLADGTAAFFIFRLAEKDTRLSDQVYSVYLSKVGANQNLPLEWVLPLAGYSFGYAEYYSMDGKAQLSGATFRPNASLSANPAFTVSFLNLAFRRIALSIEQRNRATGGNVEALNYPILFALEYLTPEVARFSPNTLPAWRELEQQGIVGTTTMQLQQVQVSIQQIYQSRIRAQKFNDSSQTPEQEAEASLENVEKLPGTCERDVVYSSAALLFSSRKNFKRALEIADKIEDLKQSESVQQAILIEMAESAIENGDLEEAQKKVEKISSHEHRAILYVKLAQALGKQNINSEDVVNETTKLTEKLPNAQDRAGVLFSLFTVLLKKDPIEAQTVLTSAIKNLNKQEPTDNMSFSVPLKVSLSCHGEDSWYGGFETLPNSKVFDALTLFAKQNPDEASRSAEEIDDKITKIRALAMITRVALASRRIEATVPSKRAILK